MFSILVSRHGLDLIAKFYQSKYINQVKNSRNVLDSDQEHIFLVAGHISLNRFLHQASTRVINVSDIIFLGNNPQPSTSTIKNMLLHTDCNQFCVDGNVGQKVGSLS